MNSEYNDRISDNEPEEQALENGLIHVTWESPVFDLSGYAASSRSALQGLEEAGIRLRLIPSRSKGEKRG